MYNTTLQNHRSVNPHCEDYDDMITLRFMQSGRKPAMEYQAEQLNDCEISVKFIAQ